MPWLNIALYWLKISPFITPSIFYHFFTTIFWRLKFLREIKNRTLIACPKKNHNTGVQGWEADE